MKIFCCIFLIMIMMGKASYAENLSVNCDDLTGTWQGSIKNPDKLFGDGGPWTIQIQFQNVPQTNKKLNHLFGIISVADHSLTSINGPIFAICKAGQLTQVVTTRQDCGRYGNGQLADHSHLTLNMAYENAMIDADFIGKLHKINNQIPALSADILKAFPRQPLVTCH